MITDLPSGGHITLEDTPQRESQAMGLNPDCARDQDCWLMDGVDCGNEEVWGFFHIRTHADRLDDWLWSRDLGVGLGGRCRKWGCADTVSRLLAQVETYLLRGV